MIYLDNAATTRQYDEVTERIAALSRDCFGNPSALHHLGLTAEKTLREARKLVSASLSVGEKELYFTGSGTEGDNTAIFGGAAAGRRRGNRIITTAVEHPAVLESCRALEQQGFRVDYLSVNQYGQADLQQLESLLDESVILVSAMQVNNELGTLEPVEEIGRLVKAKSQALFHVDAVQAYGKLPVSPASFLADLVAISAHKIHGPKGLGALYIKEGLNIPAFIKGGGQERGLRSGTENIPAIGGFGLAAALAAEKRMQNVRYLRELREYLLTGIESEIADIWLNSPRDCLAPTEAGNGAPGVVSGGGQPLCSPALLNVSFDGCRGEVLLHMLEQEGIYVSTGAACSSKKKGSHVLAAAGFSPQRIEGALRFSFSAENTTEEMEKVLVCLKKAVLSMRRHTPRKG